MIRNSFLVCLFIGPKMLFRIKKKFVGRQDISGGYHRKITIIIPSLPWHPKTRKKGRVWQLVKAP